MRLLRKGITIKTMFLCGQYEPCVCEEGSIRTMFLCSQYEPYVVRKDDERRICKKFMVFDEFGVRVVSFLLQMCGVIVKMREYFGNVFVFVCYFNEKWLKNLHVFCANFFY